MRTSYTSIRRRLMMVGSRGARVGRRRTDVAMMLQRTRQTLVEAEEILAQHDLDIALDILALLRGELANVLLEGNGPP